MVDRSEIITMCRQIGGMMDAGVDILRITRVLRAQTENPRLLAFYDELDHDLKMGVSLPDALAHAPDLFSAFEVSVVHESEDPKGHSGQGLGSAFLKIADFLQKESESDVRGFAREAIGAAPPGITVEEHTASLANYSLLTVGALDGLIDHIQLAALRLLTILAGLMLALASVWASKEAGWLDPRWLNFTLCSVGALFIGSAGIWVRRSIDAERAHGIRCSFCGRVDRNAGRLQRAARHAGASICAECAASIAGGHYDGAGGRYEGAGHREGSGPLPEPNVLRRPPTRLAQRAPIADIAVPGARAHQGEVFQTVARSWEPASGEAEAIARARAVTNQRGGNATRRPVGDDPVVEELRTNGSARLGTNGRTAPSMKEADYE